MHTGSTARAAPEFDAPFRARLDELVRWRRDVRRFRSEPIADDVVRELIEGAARAPSVGYSQPWRFVSVADAGRRAAIVRNFERCNHAAEAAYADERRALYARLKLAGLREAPVHLAVFVDAGTEAGAGLGRATMPSMLEYSVAGAVGLFSLLARARGIGVGWVSILDPQAAAASLEVPPAWALVAYLCVGYPEHEDDTPELERAGWQGVDDAARTLHRR